MQKNSRVAVTGSLRHHLSDMEANSPHSRIYSTPAEFVNRQIPEVSELVGTISTTGLIARTSSFLSGSKRISSPPKRQFLGLPIGDATALGFWPFKL